MRDLKLNLKFDPYFSSEIVTFLGVTRGRGSKVKGDKVWHGGRGFQIYIDFVSDILLNGPDLYTYDC